MLPYVGVLNICIAGERRKVADEVSTEKGEIMRAIPSEVELIIELPLINRLTNFKTPSDFPFFLLAYYFWLCSHLVSPIPFDIRSTTDQNICCKRRYFRFSWVNKYKFGPF